MNIGLESYVYTALPPRHIRVLRPLVISTPGIQIAWSLELLSLADNNRLTWASFEALSYAWGDQTGTYPVICDGKKLHVHRNLHTALPYLARRPSALPIWIDAICINQANEMEKMEQIRLMSQIYTRADLV